jgi:hypothetical protein
MLEIDYSVVALLFQMNVGGDSRFRKINRDHKQEGLRIQKDEKSSDSKKETGGER